MFCACCVRLASSAVLFAKARTSDVVNGACPLGVAFVTVLFSHTRTHGVLFLQSFGSRRIIFGAAFLCAASPCPQMFSVFAVVFVAHIFTSFLLPFCFPGVRGWCAGQTIPNAPLRPAVLEGRLCSCWCNAHRPSTSKSCFTAFGVAA